MINNVMCFNINKINVYLLKTEFIIPNNFRVFEIYELTGNFFFFFAPCLFTKIFKNYYR